MIPHSANSDGQVWKGDGNWSRCTKFEEAYLSLASDSVNAREADSLHPLCSPIVVRQRFTRPL